VFAGAAVLVPNENGAADVAGAAKIFRI
jgi:hypothetical protein